MLKNKTSSQHKKNLIYVIKQGLGCIKPRSTPALCSPVTVKWAICQFKNKRETGSSSDTFAKTGEKLANTLPACPQ